MPKEKEQKPARRSVPISMTAEQDGKIDEAARTIGLSKQDTIRLSIERGLPVLIAQLTQPAT